jgi:long-chain fatty acid transport protein
MTTYRWRRAWLTRAAGGAALSAILLGSQLVQAGGLFFTDRGVRPMGRGGAFVAGADDLGAIFYNPAGIIHAKRQFLLDASWMLFHSEYTREALLRQFDPNTGEPTGQTWKRTYETSEGSAPIIPIPTIAVSHDFGIPNTAFAIGAWSPYAAGARYDARVAGEPNPGRYMLLNLDGSALIVPGIWGAHQPIPELSIGLGVEMLMGNYRSQTVMSACLPERFLCATESPDYDTTSQMDVGPIYALGGNVGVMIDPHPNVRIGASYQLPFRVDAPATVQVRVPSAAVFADAYQQGDKARVEMDFPWVARLGVEGRWTRFRGEAAFVYEAWKMHDEIRIKPEGIVLRDVLTFPDEYRISPQTIVRNFQNTWSLRFGGETWFDVGSYQLDLRGGVMYEKGAVPAPYLSTLTIDLDKIVVGIGGSVHINKNWRFDGLIARTFTTPIDVSVDEAQYPLLNPVRSNPPAYQDYVNAGHYEANATLLGVGMAVNYL